ncbi:MAG: hypothetical protein ACI8RZ_000139 [Myxococcota bacterium]|jgi:hypothetical protein
MSPIALVLTLTACRPTETPGIDEGDDTLDEDTLGGDPLYDLSHLLTVDLTLPEADWDTLRRQTRSIEDVIFAEDCQAEPFDSPFTWFEASVSLDGQTFERIEVRKKGFIGSLNEDKPSLKLDLGEFDDEATFMDARRLTLNNAVSDPALIRQCLAYAAFADAGIPASQCSLARVSVNGDDLGIFVNIEPIKKPMLEGHFASVEGNLYEGTLSDFRAGWTGTLEKKTNETEDDWSDIDALVEAAEADDDDLIAALSEVIDLDDFFRFWAMEVLTQHGDGYAGNTNNFYLYADPADGLLRFIPWGVDMTLGVWEETPPSVYASGILAWRLYGLPEGRERYADAMEQVLADAWDPDLMAARIDTMTALIEPEVSASEWSRISGEISDVRDRVEDRAGELEAVLSEGLTDWNGEPRDSFCIAPFGSVEVAFETTWGTLTTADPFTTGTSEIDLDFDDGTVLDLDNGSAIIGTAEGETVMYLPAWISPTQAILLYASVPESDITPGTLTLDLSERIGALMYLDTDTMEDFEFVSYITGDLTFTEADTTSSAPVSGTLSGQFLAL